MLLDGTYSIGLAILGLKLIREDLKKSCVRDSIFGNLDAYITILNSPQSGNNNK